MSNYDSQHPSRPELQQNLPYSTGYLHPGVPVGMASTSAGSGQVPANLPIPNSFNRLSPIHSLNGSFDSLQGLPAPASPAAGQPPYGYRSPATQLAPKYAQSGHQVVEQVLYRPSADLPAQNLLAGVAAHVLHAPVPVSGERQNKLSPNLLEALQILKFSFKRERLNFTPDLVADEKDYTISGPVTARAVDELVEAKAYVELGELFANEDDDED